MKIRARHLRAAILLLATVLTAAGTLQARAPTPAALLVKDGKICRDLVGGELRPGGRGVR
jgi:hypothetical protein